MADLSYLATPNPHPLHYKSIVDVLNDRTTDTPEKEIIIHRFIDGRRKVLTYANLQQRSTKLAKYLVSNGVNVGDSVAILGPNSLEWIVAEFAVFMTGAMVLQMQKTSESFKETIHMLKLTKCKAVFLDVEADENYHSDIKDYIADVGQNEGNEPFIMLLQKTTGILLPSIEDVLLSPEGRDVVLPIVYPESSAMIFTTSGSTGVPKMAEFTHFAIVNAPHAALYSSGGDRQTGVLFNDRPFGLLSGTPIYNIIIGNPRVFMDTRISLAHRDISAIWDVIMDEKCTGAVFLPYVLVDLLHHKDEILRHGYKLYSVGTGGQITDSHFSEICNLFCEKFFLVYGMTEVGGVTYVEITPELEAGNVGRPFPGIQVKVVGDHCAAVECGMEGEILLKSSTMLKTYRDAPEINKEKFADGGWLRTGDVGLITSNGDVIVKGKANDVIKRGSIKIFSSEVECLIANIPGVKEVFVHSVPDDRLLEEICACFVLEENVETSEEDIKQICKDKLGDNILGKSPSYYIQFDSFPRLNSGKPDKLRIKKQALEMLHIS